MAIFTAISSALAGLASAAGGAGAIGTAVSALGTAAGVAGQFQRFLAIGGNIRLQAQFAQHAANHLLAQVMIFRHQQFQAGVWLVLWLAVF